MKYPRAIWRPLPDDHSSPGKFSDRNTIVLHITDGATAAGAIATFFGSVAPNRVSAHFVIDRDGTVYQLVDLERSAWHASQANAHSIGIEHAAIAFDPSAPAGSFHNPGQRATVLQYAASGALVAWLCQQMGVPCDRAHVRSHNEASPRDGHTLCCAGGLDPDRVVRMAQQVVLPACGTT